MPSSDAPRGGWRDNPMAGASASAPAGQAPVAAGTQPGTPGETTPEGASANGFDAAAYLQTLPEDERAALASVPPAVLERLSQRTMLRSTFDRNLGQKGQELAQAREMIANLTAQNQILAAQNQAPAEPEGPSEQELHEQLFRTSDPEEHGRLLDQLVAKRAEAVTNRALESHPVFRQIQSGIALREARSSAPEGVEAQDMDAGIQILDQELRQAGANPADMDPGVVRWLAPVFGRLAKAERMASQREQPAGSGEPVSHPQAGPGVLPVAGIGGATPATQPAGGELDPFDPSSKSDVGDRMAATLARLRITPEEFQRMKQTAFLQ